MGRLLFFAIIAVLIIWMIRRFYHKDIVDKNKPPIAESEDMVCCNYCGLHLPRSESIKKANKFFCSEEHYDSSLQ